MLITKCIFNGTNQKGASRANDLSLVKVLDLNMHSVYREARSSASLQLNLWPFFGKLMTLCCLCQDASPLGLCWLNGLSWRIFLFVLQKTSFKQSLLPNESDIWMLCSAKLMSSFTELTTKLKSMFFSSKNIKCNYAAWTLINIFDEAFSGFVAVTFVSDETRCRVSCHILSLCLSPPCVCFKC